jgi:hypothetical protein
LDDEFETSAFFSARDAGELACVGDECGTGDADASSTVPNPTGGSGGTSSSVSTGGTGNDRNDASLDTPPADAGMTEGPDTGATSEGPACWVVQLNDTTHIASNNCLGIHGWNDVETDPDSAGSSLTLTYQNGDVCFAGTTAPDGWGVYSLTFANQSDWNAANLGVNGFELEMAGPLLPAELDLVYTVSGNDDYCRTITPAPTVTIPFASAHPDCSTNASSGAPDPTRLTHLRLVWPPAASAYSFDFCLELRAVP